LAQPPTEKTCIACGKTKPLGDYHRNAPRREGRRKVCKTCQSARQEAGRRAVIQRYCPSIAPEEKQCGKCGSVQPAGMFCVDKSSRDGLCRLCKQCASSVQRASRYKIPEDRVREMALAKVCEICGVTFPSTRHQHFDHRHSDGAVRGVICFGCNRIVGDSLESPAILQAVARYLQRTLSVDYRYQPYSVTDLAETDIQKVDGEKPFTPEENVECPKNSQTAQTPPSNPRFPRLRA
jgi:hypothetical protein